jgi:hypothetical protein
MPTTLTTHAIERSTYVVTAVFKDVSDALVVPDSITWTLTDEYGRVINARSAVVVTVPASSIDIVLGDKDLALMSAKDPGGRVLTVSSVYDAAEGLNLTLHDEVRFRIDKLLKVS